MVKLMIFDTSEVRRDIRKATCYMYSTIEKIFAHFIMLQYLFFASTHN